MRCINWGSVIFKFMSINLVIGLLALAYFNPHWFLWIICILFFELLLLHLLIEHS